MHLHSGSSQTAPGLGCSPDLIPMRPAKELMALLSGALRRSCSHPPWSSSGPSSSSPSGTETPSRSKSGGSGVPGVQINRKTTEINIQNIVRSRETTAAISGCPSCPVEGSIELLPSQTTERRLLHGDPTHLHHEKYLRIKKTYERSTNKALSRLPSATLLTFPTCELLFRAKP